MRLLRAERNGGGEPNKYHCLEKNGPPKQRWQVLSKRSPALQALKWHLEERICGVRTIPRVTSPCRWVWYGCPTPSEQSGNQGPSHEPKGNWGGAPNTNFCCYMSNGNYLAWTSASASKSSLKKPGCKVGGNSVSPFRSKRSGFWPI